MIHCWLVHIFHSWVGFTNHQVLLIATRNPGGTHQLRLVGSFSPWFMTGFIHPNGVVLPSTVKFPGHQATPPLSALEHPDCVICVAFSPNNRSLGMTFKRKTRFFQVAQNLGFFGAHGIPDVWGLGKWWSERYWVTPRNRPKITGLGERFLVKIFAPKNTSLWKTRGKRIETAKSEQKQMPED